MCLSIKIYITLCTASFIIAVCSCSQKPEFSIEPISQEYNERFLTGEGLDSRYFSTKDVVQYYQISCFNGIAPTVVLGKLGAFADTHYKAGMKERIKSLNVLFYRKKWFNDYGKHLYESARDNEKRTLDGYSDDLIAWVSYERLKSDEGKVIRTLSYFSHSSGGKTLELRDTLALK